MTTKTLLSLALLSLAQAASAAPPPKAVLLDFSTEAVLDSKTAIAMLGEGLPAKVWKVYAPSKYGFVSQVEGGLTGNNTCVVTARVVMITLTPTMKAPLWRPQKTATAFDAQPNSSSAQCSELAKAKLKQAIEGVVSSLVKT